MTDPKGKKTLPAGSQNAPLPIVVPSPSTQSRSAVTLSPPFDDAATTAKASPAIPKAPPMPGTAEGETLPPMRSATKTMVPSGAVRTPPQTPSTLKAQKPLVPSKPPASVPPVKDKATDHKATALMAHSPFRSEPPAPSKPPPSGRASQKPAQSTAPAHAHEPPAREAMLTMPEVPHPQTRTVVMAPAAPSEPVISGLDAEWEEPAPPAARSVPKPPPPPDELFADLPPASTSAWPPADGPARSERVDDAPLAPRSIPPVPAPTDAVGPPALVPVRSARERIDDAVAWARGAWKRVEPMGRSVFEDGRKRFLSLSKGQRIAAVACVAGGLSIPVIALAVAVATPSKDRKAASSERSPTPQASASSPAAERTASAPVTAPAVESARIVPVAPPRPSRCSVAGEPRQLAPRASKDVPIEVRIHSSRATAAVGFAVDGGTASGLVIDLAKLEVVDRFRQGAAKVTRVIPVEREGKFVFELHGRGKGAHDVHSVLLPSGTRALQWSKSAVSVADPAGGGAQQLWEIEGAPDAVRISPAGAAGTAVALKSRDGIQLGWLDADAKASGALAAIPNLSGKLGSPSLAWNGRSVLLAFANREQSEAEWTVKLAQSEFGKVPASVTAWKLPAGGPGGSAIAPSLAALPSGGWLLVWTEGEQGRREVRMQSLTPELTTIGEAVTVSGQGNAGQGVAAVADGKGIVLDLVGTRAHELWGRAIDCP